ncbi:G-protein coupled receptor family C group 5 member B [Erpetoichthys calabaricus]|uniref:G protein-coupled receptor, class C, group 5, member Ba n=1 Tax=Erpetoichthys calabaricus TaxID=27687 RepID=A0A8C4SFK0_ERPCA|nr:G-protein coupled receptor family C group 5 member B [Erpetoichthys calabaricus]XP_028669597.1 G-protein coupled receptor family C group 5 member B [Erpetoichthys calabaricus]XP_051790067.1 G-protein coupled receptor family C group 5 member B [Erpetoichthys calabaricus]
MAMDLQCFMLLLLLLSMLDGGTSHNSSTPRGCGLNVSPRFSALCDLDVVWGIVLEAVSGVGVVSAVLLSLILLARLPSITEKEKRSSVGLLLLMLFGIVGLFGLSFAFIIQADERVCIARRALWGVFFSLCFSCLLAQSWRLQKLVRNGKSPGGWQLAWIALGLTLVQVIIASEWLVLTVARNAKPACDYHPIDFTLACTFVMIILVASLMLGLFCLCGKFHKWKRNAVCLISTSVLSILLWVAWIGLYLYGNTVLGKSPLWDDPVLAVALAANGWVLLLVHAIPELHCTILPSSQPNAPDYFDTSQPPPRIRETSFDEEITLPNRTYMENKAFSFDEHSAALRAGGYRNGNLGGRPTAPFRSNVYQPTEMAVVLNGGTIPSAPPSYSGRHLW